jgi:hypothetical protein
MAEIPADLPPEQHALFRALTNHSDAANKKIVARVEKVEIAQRDTQKDTSVALAKANAACRGVSEALKRIEAIENGQNRGNKCLPQKLTLEEVLLVEKKNVESLVADAKSLQSTVVIGYHKSSGIERMDKLQLAQFVAPRTSADHCSIETRGRIGLIHFDQRERRTGPVRARDFVRGLEESQDSEQVWARIERPEQLRRAEGLARAFAKMVANSYPTENQPQSRCVDGYLLIDNVVIAPVTMFQTAASFKPLRTIVCNILSNSNRTPIDFNTPFFYQLRHSVVASLYVHYNSVSFVFDAESASASRGDEMFVDVSENMPVSSPPQVPPSLLQPARLNIPQGGVSRSLPVAAVSRKPPTSTKFVFKRGAVDCQGFREPARFPSREFCTYNNHIHVT